MKKSILLVLLAFIAFAKPSIGQLEKRADRNFQDYRYQKAIEKYTRIWEKDTLNESIIRKLAISNRILSEYKQAEIWYNKLVHNNQADFEDYYHFLKTLGYNEKQDLCYRYLDKLPEKQKDSLLNYFASNKMLETWKADTSKTRVKRLVISSESSDFGAAYYQNSLVFSSNRKVSSIINRKQTLGNYYWNLYTTDIQNECVIDKLEPFDKDVKTRYNDGPICFSTDGKEMFITRNIKVKKEGKTSFLLSLFHSVYKDEEWTKPTLLPFNMTGYSTGQPSISKDGKTLYFVSDRPGSIGGTDIYSCSRLNGSWDEVKKLGKEINTIDDEMFPFISEDDQLYFASKGHAGFGGFDIFVLNLKDNLSKSRNLGSPINTEKDDFGLIIKGRRGYFSSNRLMVEGSDDLYSLEQMGYYFNGTVLNKETEEAIDSTCIDLIDEDSKVQIFSNKDGHFKIWLAYDKSYKLLLAKDGFKDSLIKVNKLREKIFLEPNEKLFNLKTIYYAFDKADINKKAQKEFNDIAIYMKKNPDLYLELNAHTDSRGSKPYNLKLSKKRALWAREYLVSKGVDINRLMVEGLGELYLVNECEDGVDCTNEQHQQNRRVELSFIKNMDNIYNQHELGEKSRQLENGIEKPYHIIDGSFKYERNAEGYLKQLKMAGLDANLVSPRNGLWYVSIGSFYGLESAKLELSKLKERLPLSKAWIYRKR